jgi:hypothetical protein
MKNVLIPVMLMLLTLFSCEKKEVFVYEYETNPQYTWGYAEFYGSWYAAKGVENNVLSLYAFTDSLLVNDESQLYGFGQYLFLEDIFLEPTDTLFPEGTYSISNSREAFTIAPGEEFEEEGKKADIGAYIIYYEKNDSYSIRKFIVDGSMTVVRVGEYTRFDFDFILDDEDSTELKGRYDQYNLAYYDESVYPQEVVKQKVVLNPMKGFTPEKFISKPQNKRRQKGTSK